MTGSYIMVFLTTSSKLEAEKIAQSLLKEKLIACANIICPVTSFFHWMGSVEGAEECLVVMKSRVDLFAELVGCVKGLHSYEVPEILALPIVDGSEGYLAWMGEVLKQ
jgi:periplasmic divalent cation tolerance protein